MVGNDLRLLRFKKKKKKKVIGKGKYISIKKKNITTKVTHI